MKESEKNTRTLPENYKKNWKIKVTMTLIVAGALGTVPKGMEKTGGRRNQRKIRDHPDHNIVKID